MWIRESSISGIGVGRENGPMSGGVKSEVLNKAKATNSGDIQT